MGSVNDDCLYRATVRVTTWDWRAHAWLNDLPGFGDLNLDPWAVGPEVEFQFDVGGLSAEGAEARARRRLEVHGISVLAVRVKERTGANA